MGRTLKATPTTKSGARAGICIRRLWWVVGIGRCREAHREPQWWPDPNFVEIKKDFVTPAPTNSKSRREAARTQSRPVRAQEADLPSPRCAARSGIHRQHPTPPLERVRAHASPAMGVSSAQRFSAQSREVTTAKTMRLCRLSGTVTTTSYLWRALFPKVLTISSSRLATAASSSRQNYFSPPRAGMRPNPARDDRHPSIALIGLTYLTINGVSTIETPPRTVALAAIIDTSRRARVRPARVGLVT